jgi:hypothetical protein
MWEINMPITRFLFIVFIILTATVFAADWLIDPAPFKAHILDTPKSLILKNDLIQREITLAPNAATISFRNLVSQEEFIRSVRPEAELEIDGLILPVGGLEGQPVHNYVLPQWLDSLTANPLSFHFVDYSVGPTVERFPWKKRLDWMPQDLPWPPPGKQLQMNYLASPQLSQKHPTLKDVIVTIHYEIYDGIPLISKWFTLKNNSQSSVTIDKFKSEILAFVEPESYVEKPVFWMLPNMTVMTDYAFGGDKSSNSTINKSVFWETDSLYLTQVNYLRQMPCLLECKPKIGPQQIIPSGGTFESFLTFELLHDNWDRERKGLAERKMYRAIAPWCTENPILMHVRQADDKSVKLAIDQCAEVGFEMVIMTFGSGFNLEDQSRKNIKRMKELTDYAHSKGVALGGYSLLASRSINKENDVIMPEGQTPQFGHSPCLQSEWGQNYFDILYDFYETTGMDILEHDGSYPGDVCASQSHPGHKNLEDSQWNQYQKITQFYQWCRSKGIYLNVPDWYFLQGSSKIAMGYRETNWSLPRKQQEIVERQNVYDGTWTKTPSMGWMFVPLTQYHGGGAAATIEPLKDHLRHYEQRLVNLFGAGVQACYRGPRLYDSPETKTVVKKWVDFYKKYRAILDSDIIHVRRADGRQLDCILHVNPQLDIKGLVMIYNPTDKTREEILNLPLYYTGLTETASIGELDNNFVDFTVARDYSIELPVAVEPFGVTWFVIK